TQSRTPKVRNVGGIAQSAATMAPLAAGRGRFGTTAICPSGPSGRRNLRQLPAAGVGADAERAAPEKHLIARLCGPWLARVVGRAYPQTRARRRWSGRFAQAE